jgi:hypothetical protein
LWGGAALFFRNNDTADLRSALELLVREQAVRREYANLAYERARQRFAAARMVDEYLELYEALSSQQSAFSRRAVVLPYQPSDREGSSGAEC